MDQLDFVQLVDGSGKLGGHTTSVGRATLTSLRASSVAATDGRSCSRAGKSSSSRPEERCVDLRAQAKRAKNGMRAVGLNEERGKGGRDRRMYYSKAERTHEARRLARVWRGSTEKRSTRESLRSSSFSPKSDRYLRYATKQRQLDRGGCLLVRGAVKEKVLRRTRWLAASRP